ncbi:MAG TPA: phage holin, LLH family [Candidatus Acidoferrales bacterium]|nr:phage holin, LLH family [Candidatus Acidoferrales bacterium]
MSMSSVFKSIGHGVKTAAKYVEGRFVALFGEDAAKKFVQDSYTLLQSAVGKIVSQVVKDLNDTALDSAGKRETAVKQVLEMARQQGIQIVESEVRLLIELAVQFVQGKFKVEAVS